MAGGTEVTTLVPLRLDLRFASTQRPEDIHDRTLHIGPGRSRFAEFHSPGSGR